MTAIPSKYSKYDWVEKRRPDPQVKDVADQFFDASEILWHEESGVLIPSIISCVLAIELYLKSLSSYSIVKDIQDHGDGAQGGIVLAIPEIYSHKLTEIFDCVEEDIRKEFESRWRESTAFRCGVSFRDVLSVYDSVFVGVRYVFEDSSTLRSINCNELHELMILTKSVVESIPREHWVLR